MPDARSALNAVQLQLRRRILLRGLLQFVAAAMGMFLLLALCDWLVRANAPLWRWTCAALLASGGLVLCWRLLIRAWLHRVTLLDVALQCERLNPQLQGRLATEIARGNPIDVTTDFKLPRVRLAPIIWSGVSLIVLSFTTVGLAIWQPQLSQIAVARLLLPADSIRWPRQTDLQLMTAKGTLLTTAAPLMIDSYQPLTLYVRDSEGEAPAEIHWETKDAQGRIERHPVRRAEGTERRYDFRFTWLPPAGGSWVRVAGGGDNSMGWCPLESRTAPQIAATNVTLKYPEYLHHPPTTLETLPAKLSVPVGTELSLTGRLDREVVQVRRVTPGAKPQLMTLNQAGDGFEWTVILNAAQRELYWFEPIDSDGLTTSRPIRHELITLPDSLPEARFVEPVADLYITAQAQVPIEINVHDDHAVRRLELLTDLDGTPHVCWQQEWSPGDVTDSTISLRLQSTPAGDDSASDVVPWPFTAIQEGQQIRLEARVYDFLSETDRLSVSPARILRVVSAEEKLRELEQRVRGQHERIHDHVAALTDWHAEHRQLETPDVDHNVARIHAMHWQQYRQLLLQGSQLLRHGQGATEVLKATVREAGRNRLDAHVLAEPLQRVVTQLDDLGSHELAAAESAQVQVANALSGHREGEAPDHLLRNAAPEVARMELAATNLLRTWQEIEEAVSRWSSRRNSIEELDRLLAEFEKIRTETVPLAQRTVALSAAQLSPTDRSQLANLAGRHNELANGYQKLLADQSTNSSEVEQFTEFQQKLAELRVVSELQEIGALLGRNNIGQALQKQSDLLRRLDEAYQQLRGTSLADIDSFRQQIGEETERAEELFLKQQTLTKDVARLTYSEEPEARQELERLIKEHEQQSLDLSELSRHLRQMGMRPQGQRIDKAGEALGRSRSLLPKQQKEHALVELEQAEQQLGEVLQDLKQQHDRLENESLAARSAKTGAILAALADRQFRLAEETVRLRRICTDRGRWTRGELKSLSDAAESERQLIEELLQARLQLTNLSLFQAVTDDIARTMRQAEELLRGRDVATPTEDLQRMSARQLDGLAQALQLHPQESETNSSHRTTTEPSTESQGIPALTASQAAEIRLIIALQLQLADEAESLLNQDGLTDERREQSLDRIAKEQSRLTQWMTALLRNEAVEVAP